MIISGIKQVFKGTVIHSKELNKIEILHDALVGVSELGKISFVQGGVTDQNTYSSIQQKYGFLEDSVIDLGKKILIPGFIDTHAHAPQYHNAGTGTDLPLLKWLEKYTFPTECKFEDLKFADNVYRKVVARMLRNGTTTCCYYATIHLPATKLLCDLVSSMGQRAFVGKVCMDRNSPSFYVEESAEASARDTELFIETVKSTGNELVQPIVTPRFAPSCSDELMTSLAKISDKHNTLIQSHISENVDEVKWVQSLYPSLPTYTDVYKHFGLLNERTIMAHGCYLSDDELDTFHQCGAGVSHCPVSNFTLSSGTLDVRKVLAKNIKLGLGTDVSGGFSASLLTVIRDVVKCSSSIFFHKDPNHTPLSWEEAFYLATVGGSKVVGLEDRIGNFVEGKDFDAQIIDPYVAGSPFDVFEADTTKDIFQKFIFLGDDRNVSKVYVKGNQINLNNLN